MVPAIVKIFENWPLAILHYLGFFNVKKFSIGPYIIYTLRNGVKFKVSTNARADDIEVILSIWHGKHHIVSKQKKC